MAGNQRSRRWWRREDIRHAPLPVLRPDDWLRDPESAAELLRCWADGEGEQAVNWYLQDKASKRFGSRLLRGCAIVLALAGGLAPLVSTGRGGPSSSNWGYVLLAVAAGLVAFDHFFGLSSGWMRDMSTAQALQRRLTEFRLTWAEASAAEVSSGSAVNPSGRLQLVASFVRDVDALIASETGEWLTEFRTNVGQLQSHVDRSGVAAVDAVATDTGRGPANQSLTAHP